MSSANASREHAVRQAEITRLALALGQARRQLAGHRAQLLAIVDDIAPGLTSRFGVGPVSAAQAIVSFSHPGRCRTEAAFAAPGLHQSWQALHLGEWCPRVPGDVFKFAENGSRLWLPLRRWQAGGPVPGLPFRSGYDVRRGPFGPGRLLARVQVPSGPGCGSV